jgi:acyl-CoA thioester hydrolase
MRDDPAKRSGYRHFTRHSTRWGDNDAYGHLNNVVHYALFDSTVNSWLIEQGLLDPRSSEIIGLVVETGCRYHSELSYPAPVDAGLRVARIGRSSVRYELGLFAEQSDTAAAEGFFVHVYVDAKSRRPVAIPGPMRDALSKLLSE